MRILITGGCGYLGGYFVKYLDKHFADKIDELVIYDNLSRGDMAFLFGQDIDNLKVTLWQNDILDRRNLLKALKDIDVVIHMAAKVSQPYTDVKLHPFDQVNNWGSSNLADVIDEAGVKKAIYISSITAYGTSSKVIDESFIPEPQTYYGVSKLKGERHFSRISNADVFILRCANAYGYSPTMRLDSVFNRLMFEAHHKGRVNRIGDGSQSRAFVSLESFSEQLAQVVLTGNIEPGIYNVANTNLSINKVLELYFELFPELEVITIEQNVKLKSLNVEIPTKLGKLLNTKKPEILAELKEFHAAFSF